MRIVILDTETTGLGPDARIVELGIIVMTHELEIEHSMAELCNPHTPIDKKASKIHNIYDEDLKEKKSIQDTDVYKLFQKYNTKENILVIHNSWFDLYYLYKSECPKWKGNVLDTLICSRQVNKKLQQHTLGYLAKRHSTHRALGDCEMVIEVLSNMTKKKKMTELVEMTKTPTIGFGIWKGKPFKDILPGYLKWLLDNYTTMDMPTQIYIKNLLKVPLTTEETRLYEYVLNV